jgi:hypothetical protein
MMMMTSLALTVSLLAQGERPLLGDLTHGQKVLADAGGSVRVDGAWLNRFTDEQCIQHLSTGSEGFPAIESENVLDRWDVLAVLRQKNTDMRDLVPGANFAFVAEPKLDDNAKERLTTRAKIPSAMIEDSRRVFVTYRLDDAKGLTLVSAKDKTKRDALKRDKKVGYVVFVELPGLRGGGHEAAIAVDKDVRITGVTVRAKDGSEPEDLNQAAARFVGKGVRGKYEELRAGGAGKAVGEITSPLSRAYLIAMESVYMYEVEEKDYFAFD